MDPGRAAGCASWLSKQCVAGNSLNVDSRLGAHKEALGRRKPGLALHRSSRVAGRALVFGPHIALTRKRSGGGGRVSMWSRVARLANMCPNAQEAFHLHTL